MIDVNILILVSGVVIAAAGIVGTQLYNRASRKEHKVETRQTMMADVEEVAREKSKQEQLKAEALATGAAQLAREVKQDMKDHIDRLILILKGDIELQRALVYAKIDTIDNKIAQNRVDLMNHIEQEKDERVRMQRSIDFFQTMQFGPEAKSIPPYITGEERTSAHEEEAYKGVFASRADTTHKDTKDPSGHTTKETKAQQDIDAETESEEGGGGN